MRGLRASPHQNLAGLELAIHLARAATATRLARSDPAGRTSSSRRNCCSLDPMLAACITDFGAVLGLVQRWQNLFLRVFRPRHTPSVLIVINEQVGAECDRICSNQFKAAPPSSRQRHVLGRITWHLCKAPVGMLWFSEIRLGPVLQSES